MDLYEGDHGAGRAERVLDGPEEVVGLEDEDHLPVDDGQDVGDLAEVLLRAVLDLPSLHWQKKKKIYCEGGKKEEGGTLHDYLVLILLDLVQSFGYGSPRS